MSKVTKRRILLVEDDIVQGLGEKRALEKCGYEVTHVSTGEKALQFFQDGPQVDLVLMDIDLGEGIDGTEVARIILAQHEIPIVFLSSHIEPTVVAKTEEITSYGYVVKDSSYSVLEASLKMAFKLWEANQRIQENEARFFALFQKAPLGYQSLDEDGHFIEINEAWLETLGYNREEVVGKWFGDFLAPEFVEPFRQRFPIFKAQGKIHSEFQMLHKAGHRLYIAFEGRIGYKEDGEFQQTHCILSDITELKRQEFALRESENRFQELFHNIPVAYQSLNEAGCFVNVNEFWLELMGYPREEVLGKTFGDFWTEEIKDQFSERFTRLKANGCVNNSELALVRKNGQEIVVVLTGRVQVDAQGQFVATHCIIVDITQRKLDEEKIHKLLQEKEFLLKDVHHRIKNNMSAIYWLLTLQAESVQDAAAVAALQDAGNRVQSMMLLYDKLYRSENFTDLSVPNYLTPLAQEIIRNFPTHQDVYLDIQIEDFLLDAKRMSYMGILCNELLTNAMKHAFLPGQKGNISIKGAKIGDRVNLTIADDGVGLPPGVDFSNVDGFGMQLVAMVTDQLQGVITLEKQNGTKFHLEFPV